MTEQTTLRPPTLAEVVAIEPEVGRILDEARRLAEGEAAEWPNPHFVRLKGRLKSLVGFQARHPRLRASKPFEVVIGELASVLGM